MTRRQVSIYATKGDLAELLTEVCGERDLGFVVGGLSEMRTPNIVGDIQELAPFTTYLVFEKGQDVRVREVSQRDGTIKYAVDQLDNPTTVVLQCGGLLNEARLLAGQVGTATEDIQSRNLYALFQKTIRRKYDKIRAYYVGIEAAQLLDKGVRLTPTAKSPEAYDLVR